MFNLHLIKDTRLYCVVYIQDSFICTKKLYIIFIANVNELKKSCRNQLNNK
jgi:hypothetical protein